MSMYYYPHLFNSKAYLAKKGSNPDTDELLTEFTDFETEFPLNIDDISAHFMLDDQLSGSLSNVISQALEEEIVDIEDESKQEKLQKIADILSKLCDKPTSLNLIPYLGFITDEEVEESLEFLKSFSFQNNQVEDLKNDMLILLGTASQMNMGLIYVVS